MKKLLFVLLTNILFYSCDKIDCPNGDGCVEPIAPAAACIDSITGLDTCTLSGELIIHNAGLENDTENLNYQKIVLEEFTGIKCPSCPKGARKITELLSIFGDSLIAVSIHAGSFSEPGDKSNHSYDTDFRTEAGNQFNTDFLGAGAPYPSAMVNRTLNSTNGKYFYPGELLWENVITSEIDNSDHNSPLIYLTSYLSLESNTLLVKANVTFNEVTTNEYRLLFLCIEDSVSDVQLDAAVSANGGYVDPYIHNHVLRGAMDNSLGELVTENGSSIGEKFTVESSYFELDPFWNSENIEVIALLINVQNGEHVQAEKVHIR